jgi:hypothetical protein
VPPILRCNGYYTHLRSCPAAPRAMESDDYSVRDGVAGSTTPAPPSLDSTT